ncbi:MULTISPECIES: helicase-related protein [Flavobacteriaceae]|uniref:Helicase n=2 Tax=Flavobacteriaceae TaxID=49546 RepID=A0A4Y8AWY6_9FLAO|nr:MULTISPECIES: helicase-related protein [Flavobacteriaceae]TEW76518.1 helicase [Gramella jeungdoensis]GGK53645.1 ATP-dependent helicase [Lutibacter litoralis]
MANNFIANKSPQKTLSGRLNNIIKFSTELRWLVGFFYFSGWKEVCQNLKNNPEIKIKLLVGLQVGNHLQNIFEHDVQELDLSSDEYFNDFMSSMGFAVNNEQQDTKEFYEQVHFFLDMIRQERLIIKKTREPNHAKLYLFEMNEEERSKHNFDGYLITGSSNLTRNGLQGQQEFNVEIKDYGYEEAVAYFEELWELAIPITDIDQRKQHLIDFIIHRSQAALVQPFDAYALVLKTYLDLQKQKKLKPQVERLLEDSGFNKFSYQIDAVNQALGIIEENNGVVIADVVGLGKSVIASLIARNLDTKGIILCPPGLIGDYSDKTGWWGYVRNFNLNGWHVYSRGQVENLAEDLDDSDIDTVIIDEAHNFRNQDTAAYEALAQICRGKQVILLTATPFNNSPADIFALLKLFIVPGLSTITLENNLEGLFRSYSYRFSKLSDILKNYNANNPDKRDKAEKLYVKLLDEELPVNPQIVRQASAKLANTIKEVISPVVIRRNRLDLENDHQYSAEIGELPKVAPPVELFYYLTQSQSEFYDRIVRDYFAEDGLFTGAIYQPSSYETIADESGLDMEGNRTFQQQRNLFDFMRRLLVKRFESSFGAFQKTIERFIQVHEVVLQFIENTGGKYILDRNLIEKIYEYDEDEILDILYKFENDLLKKKTPKNTTVYKIKDFQKADEFLEDINKDLDLFKKIRREVEEEKLVANDPKRETIYQKVSEILENEPNRKVILFTEYVDTVLHLEPYFREKFGNKLIICDGKVSKALAKDLERNFNAQYEGTKYDNFQVLITSDKLSEGFNLNRAGVIINYDIPWNPTRVIQRVGRINRIGKKVFDKLYIFNFFPSETGADFVKSREIAQQKMFMIHNALGEDSRIFHPDEEPTASGLYKKMNDNPEDDEELNIITHIRNKYNQIEEEHPDVIERILKLPNRVKTAKKFKDANVNVLRKKGLSLFAQQAEIEENPKVESLTFENFLQFIECAHRTKRVPMSEDFWPIYEKIKDHKERVRSNTSDLSIEKKAHDNLKVALKIIDASEEENINFIKTIIKDIKHYYTMPKYTLRRLALDVLSASSAKAKWKQFFEELDYIKDRYGLDYLDKVLEKVKDKKDEVIIAIENRS